MPEKRDPEKRPEHDASDATHASQHDQQPNEGPRYDQLRAVDPSLYDELRAIAARALRSESRSTAPGTTSLVHEIWLRLARSDRNPVHDQQHLLALASLVARRALVDDARTKSAGKRGDGHRPIALPTDVEGAPREPAAILSIDESLTRLAERYPRQAKALEMRMFGDISPENIAIALGISPTQAKRDVAFARAWLVAAHSDTSTTGPDA